MKRWSKILPIIVITVGAFVPTWVDALTFTPEIIDANLDPGVSHAEALTVFNETGEPVSLIAEALPLTIIDAQAGHATFDQNAQPVPWIQLHPEQFVLEPGEQREVEVMMTAPTDASGSLIAGIAMTFRPVRSDGAQVIAVNAVTGPYIFAEVRSQKSVREGFIASLTPIGGSRVSKLPVTLAVSFANTGDTHLRPTGTFEVQNLFGQVIDQGVVNPNGSTVLPATERTFYVTWDRTAKESISPTSRQLWRPRFGPYTLNVEMTSGDVVDSSSTTIWVVPWRAFVLLGTVLVLLLVVYRRTRRVKL